MNSPYKENLNFDESGKTSVNLHPPVLREKDIKNIESSEMFFARKLDMEVDAKPFPHFC